MFFLKVAAPVFSIFASFALASVQDVFPAFPPQYSSGFKTPEPPLVNTTFRANFMQHKYDVNVNNIASGYLYMSPAQQKIRLDAAFDGVLESSIFDFANTTSNGTVLNTILSYNGGLANPQCSSFYADPFIQLVPPNFLAATSAVYLGIQQDDIYGPVSAWLTTFDGGAVSITFFLDASNTLVRYDFAVPGPLRTFATTRFFNIVFGEANATTFETSCR